jgi:hypothetical protein
MLRCHTQRNSQLHLLPLGYQGSGQRWLITIRDGLKMCGPRNLLFCNGLHQARLRSSTALGAVVLLLQAGAMNCFLTRMRRLKPSKSLLPPVLREGKATTAVITGCVPPGASSSCSKGLQWSATVHTESGCALISSKELIFSHNIVFPCGDYQAGWMLWCIFW